MDMMDLFSLELQNPVQSVSTPGKDRHPKVIDLLSDTPQGIVKQSMTNFALLLCVIGQVRLCHTYFICIWLVVELIDRYDCPQTVSLDRFVIIWHVVLNGAGSHIYQYFGLCLEYIDVHLEIYHWFHLILELYLQWK